MIAKSALLAALIAYAEARFGQEQVPISAIAAVQGGAPGAAATIAGGAVSTLLGAADPCEKLRTADNIITQLGTGADALAAAIGLVSAEKNTNPFANGNAQVVCADPSLPATQALRGITPLIDPGFTGAAAVNDLSKQTVAAPLDATGLSVFDLIQAKVPGVVTAAGAAAGGAAAGGNNAAAGGNDQQANNTAQAGGNDNAQQNTNDNSNACQVQQGAAANETAQAGGNDQQAAAGNDQQAAAGAGGNVVGNADFGKCTPTITFEAGRPGRKADEFTFQIGDPIARGGQQDALNPNIITNALCNQLVNVCGANAAALSLCADAKAKVAALTTRDKAVADTFNTAIGFPGAITNPDGGPADVGQAAARRVMRRGYRMAA